MTILGVVQPDGSIVGPQLDLSILSRKVYVVDGGDTFEGTAEQFEDCFGGPATEYAIRDWCDRSGCSLRIIYL